MTSALRVNVKAEKIGDALDRITEAFQSGTMSSATSADKQTLVNGTIKFVVFSLFFYVDIYFLSFFLTAFQK